MTEYKYKSKYNKIEADSIMNVDEKKEKRKEYLREYVREYSKFWLAHQTYEKKKELANIKRIYMVEHPDYRTGFCDCCKKEYKNIYNHNRTKAHLKREST